MPQDAAADLSSALWKLHLDISRLYREMSELSRFCEALYDPEQFGWLQDRAREESDRYPRCKCNCWPVCWTLERSHDLTHVAKRILSQQELLHWFAKSQCRPQGIHYERLEDGRYTPSEIGYTSYHQQAFELASKELQRLRNENAACGFRRRRDSGPNAARRYFEAAAGIVKGFEIDTESMKEFLRYEALVACNLCNHRVSGPVAVKDIDHQSDKEDEPADGQQIEDAPPKSRISVSTDPPQVTVDNHTVSITRDEADCLQCAMDSGTWISSSEIETKTSIKRADRKFRSLQRKLPNIDFIESTTGRGFRIKPEFLPDAATSSRR